VSERIRVIDEGVMEDGKRWRVVQWRDGTYEHQVTYATPSGGWGYATEPLSNLDVWDRYPDEVPSFEREHRFIERQAARRERVWWRRMLREWGWR